MYLSKLQKYILLECYLSKKRRYSKKELLKFYDRRHKKTKEKERQGDITRSVERLINKGLLVGYGEKTAQKLFINQIKLTSLGRRVSRELLDKQQKLPFKKLTKKHEKNTKEQKHRKHSAFGLKTQKHKNTKTQKQKSGKED